MADNIVFANNASALLAATIASGDLTIQVAAGYGALFPSPGASEHFFATLEAENGGIEVVKCTSRAGDNLTVVRAQDGTTAQAFTLNTTRVEVRVTKIVLTEFLQKNGGTMTGDVNFNQKTLTDPYISGSNTRITAGQIVGVPLRGALGQSSNELVVPPSGRATVGGVTILATGDDLMSELDTAGVIIFDSATTGINMDQAGAYFRMLGALRVAASASAGDYGEQSHDDTDYNWNFVNTVDLNFTGLTGDINVNGITLREPNLVDFSIKQQTVAAAATTNIDYTLGAYVKVTMGANISTLNLNNVPGTDVGTLRLKFVQDATGGRTCDFTGITFAGGIAPVLSLAANAIDFVDVWYDGAWYGAYNNNWS